MPKAGDGQPADTIEIVDENLRQGFAQVPRPILRAKGLSIKAKLVYIALLDYAWQKGSCFPGQGKLAEDLDSSVDTIYRALIELKQYDLLDWTRQGLNKANVYHLLRLSDCAHLDVSRRNPQAAESGIRNLRILESATLRNKEYSKKNTHITSKY